LEFNSVETFFVLSVNEGREEGRKGREHSGSLGGGPFLVLNVN
jgi:hypothetical protein